MKEYLPFGLDERECCWRDCSHRGMIVRIVEFEPLVIFSGDESGHRNGLTHSPLRDLVTSWLIFGAILIPEGKVGFSRCAGSLTQLLAMRV